MKKIIFCIGLVAAGLTVQAQQARPAGSHPSKRLTHHQTKPAQVKESNATITWTVIPALNNTFGYDIFVDGKKKISQATIPGMSGKEGFRTREAAESVAEMVALKMKKGQFPPAVTHEELRNLKAVN
jgi:hypothetical protein